MRNDRRDTPRVPIALEALLLSGKSGLKRARTRDISLDGVFVLTPDMRPADGPIDMAIRLPGGSANGPSMAHSPRLDPIGETATATSLSRGPRLDPIGEGAGRYYRFVAKPVRVEATGAGFSFEYADSEAYAALLGLVFTRAPAETA
jgi:hypothetical protein